VAPQSYGDADVRHGITAGHAIEWRRFAVIVLEFALITATVRTFELVSEPFGQLMALALSAFLVHHFLPAGYQMVWFVAVSLAGLYVGTGGHVAANIVFAGLILIGACHLPLRIGWRIAILLACGAGIAALRTGGLWAPVNSVTWALLSAMVVFRLFSYLYELHYRTAPFSVGRSLAYFFMLPSACFTLLPVVDYRTFATCQFNAPAERIYQTGLTWMLRGITHLLVYRLVYQLALVDPLEATDLASVAQYMVATYLLYLRVSGWFHLIVGLLHMFGFNLPETHHLYLLSTSFTDFWRRINIYWKDFMLKLFFYPLYFRTKRWGLGRAMAVATLFVFLMTWLLHAAQFFWLRGEWLLSSQDVLFWSALAVLVLANALWEARRGQRRSLTGSQRTWQSETVRAITTMGTFAVICTLWTVWSARSWDELRWLAAAAGRGSVSQWAAVLGGLAMIGACGVWLGHSGRESSSATNHESARGFWRPAGLVAASCTLLLVCHHALQASWIENATLRRPLVALTSNDLNRLDREALRRGYYEDLDVARNDRSARFLLSRTPDNPWLEMSRKHLERRTKDFLVHALHSSVRVDTAGGLVSTNRWGMRDRDYEPSKPAGTTRIALLGSSHEMGWGVSDGQIFESLVEERLNHARPSGTARVEILNFACGGLSAFQQLYLLETRVGMFSPDAVIFVLNSGEEGLLLDHLSEVLANGYESPFAIIDETAAKAGVEPGMSPPEISARLRPFAWELFTAAVGQFATECEARGLKACLAFRPSPATADAREKQRDSDFFARLQGQAKLLRVQLLDLRAAFAGVGPHESMEISIRDDHTGVRGHQLVADELYRQLTAPAGRWLLLGEHAGDDQAVPVIHRTGQ
jgi:hypothetical protein